MITFENCIYIDGKFQLSANFTVIENAFVAVLGPSGAGKSTLLSLIAGFVDVTSGDVLIDKKSMANLAPANRPVSLVFQDHNSFAHLNAWNNVALGLSPSLTLSSAQEAQVNEALAAVGIAHLAKRKPGEMSGGERQRIALARVLVRQKPILLLDEAFAALGPGLRRDMLALVKSLHQSHRLTTLMVTHQPEDAKAVADAVVFIDNGKVDSPLPTKTFFQSKNAAVRDYLGS